MLINKIKRARKSNQTSTLSFMHSTHPTAEIYDLLIRTKLEPMTTKAQNVVRPI